MNFRNPDDYNNTLVDFTVYNECFELLASKGAKPIKGGDIDFFVKTGYGLEKLIIEFKTYGSDVTSGQLRLFERELILGRCTVIVAWHSPQNMNEVVEFCYASTFNDECPTEWDEREQKDIRYVQWEPIRKGNRDKIIKFCSEWAKSAEEIHPYIFIKSKGWGVHAE